MHPSIKFYFKFQLSNLLMNGEKDSHVDMLKYTLSPICMHNGKEESKQKSVLVFFFYTPNNLFLSLIYFCTKLKCFGFISFLYLLLIDLLHDKTISFSPSIENCKLFKLH